MQSFGSNTAGILVDNGSLSAYAPLLTRKIATELSKNLGFHIQPASLAHSNRIALEATQGLPVALFSEALNTALKDPNIQKVLVVPFLLVTGGAIYSKIEAIVDAYQSESSVQIALSPALIGRDSKDSVKVAELIRQSVLEALHKHSVEKPKVCLVDHGSPLKVSADCRNRVAAIAGDLLGDKVSALTPCSMESREGPEYAFNLPLYQSVLVDHARSESEALFTVRLFLQPGRHSGKRGDLDAIESEVMNRYPNLKIVTVRPFLAQKKLRELVRSRYIELHAN